ncbi:MAG TPA: hypothetical protein VF756_09660 [Thermoanaerobaculia bacterium]
MRASLFPLLFAVYWMSVLVWSLMAERLRLGLSQRHPLLWAALGRPAGMPDDSLRGNLALLDFLLRRRDRFTEDRELARLCGAMRFLLAGYALFFVTVPALL